MTALTEREPYRILVTGSRHCTEDQAAFVQAKIHDHVLGSAWVNLRRPTIVVHGKCPNGGVDLAAQQLVDRRLYGDWLTAEPHPADWDRHGRAAGPIRNAEMVALGADVCLAFPSPGSRGTWGCVQKAADALIPVQVWPLGLA